MYSDNGTNFPGADNLFRSIDWKCIERQSTISRIQWKLNPPTAAWWGGWWERIVQMNKYLLKRVLGRTAFNYEEMSSVLCDCESVINSRPLTYLSEDPEDLYHLTLQCSCKKTVRQMLPTLILWIKTILRRNSGISNH